MAAATMTHHLVNNQHETVDVTVTEVGAPIRVLVTFGKSGESRLGWYMNTDDYRFAYMQFDGEARYLMDTKIADIYQEGLRGLKIEAVA